MGFFSIRPRNGKYGRYSKIPYIPLRVIQNNNGVELNPDFDVQQTDLNNGYKHFKVENGKANSFKVSVIIHRDDEVSTVYTPKKKTVPKDVQLVLTDRVIHTDFGDADVLTGYDYGPYDKDMKVRSLLNAFMRTLTPLVVVSNIMGVSKNNLYVITENKARTQEYRDYTVWDLTFTQYVEVKYGKFKGSSKGVQKALKALKKKNKSKSNKVSTATKLRKQLKKCKPSVLVYSKKKKTVACVKTLQKYLNERLGTKLVADGWFGKETKKAVIKYQNKFSKSYGLKPTGKVNTKTYNVMIGKGKKVKTSKATVKTTNKKTTKKTTNKNKKPQQIGKTINIKSDSTGILK